MIKITAGPEKQYHRLFLTASPDNHTHTFINNSTCSQCQSYSRTGALTVAELHHRGSEENLTIHSERSRAEFSDVTAEVMRQEVLGRSGLEEINLEQSSSGLRVCVCKKNKPHGVFIRDQRVIVGFKLGFHGNVHFNKIELRSWLKQSEALIKKKKKRTTILAETAHFNSRSLLPFFFLDAATMKSSLIHKQWKPQRNVHPFLTDGFTSVQQLLTDLSDNIFF